jgi:hypothetical protein
MAIIFEDSAKVTKKQIPIPQNAKNVFKAMKKIYEPYLDKNIPGSKILKSLGSDKKYNKKGANAQTNGKEIKQDSVNVNDAKVRLHRMNKLPKNSIQYQLNGGELAANLYRKGIERARGTKEVEAVKPPKPTTNADLKPADTKPETIKTPSGKITYTVTAENRMIREAFGEEHPYYNYLEEYNEAYVFNEFLSNPNGKQSWGVLINPDMYAKALREFTQYGKLVKFPTRYVYQWMGIIMKNTAILEANTNIAGHSQWFPIEDFEDFIISYFGNNREINIDYNDDKVKIEIFPKDVLKLLDKEFTSLNEAVDKYGQTYFPWVSQGDADRMVAQQDLERQKNKFSQMYGDIDEYIAEFNQNSRHYEGEIEADYDTSKLYWVIDALSFLGIIGFYDWMQMPDGSDAFSDFGLEPLERVLYEYDENLPPEKVLVIVNKALDVYHQRGDMASIFVTGGSRALSRIAEHKIKNPKKVYLTEKQIFAINEKKKEWTIDHFRPQERIDNNLKLLLEYPHYYVNFLDKWKLVDDWDEEPYSTLYDLCQWVFGAIEEGDEKSDIDKGKKEIYDLIMNNEYLASLSYRYIEDYIKPRKYKQDIVDRYARKESLKDVDWQSPRNNFEIQDGMGRLKKYLEH